jgi:two-component system, NarL family, sensor kinase
MRIKPKRPNRRKTAGGSARSGSPTAAEPHGSKDSAGTHRAGRSVRIRTFENLILLLREFVLAADANGSIETLWTSTGTAEPHVAQSLLGRRLSDVLHPQLIAEIEGIARRTGKSGRRSEGEHQVNVGGTVRCYSVCAIPVRRSSRNGRSITLFARDVTHRVDALASLARNEALLAQAEQIANFGSWEIDLRTHKIKLSKQLLKIYDLESGDAWSEAMYFNRLHPADRERVREISARRMTERQPFEYVARYCAPDGRIRVHLTRTVPPSGKGRKHQRAVGVIQDITENVQSNYELRRLSQELMNGQDRDRRQIALELHESAGQSLAALKMTLGRLKLALPVGEELAISLLDSAVHVTEGAIREVRTVSYLLHPPLLDDAGLGPALRWYAKGFSERSGIRADLDIPEDFARHGQEVDTTIFRVVQEALTNVLRYSGSASVEIQLSEKDGRIRLEVRDRGCGLAQPNAALNNRAELGVGIPGMRERVKQLDGVFEMESAPGAGTTVRVTLPAAQAKVLLNRSHT